jgi:signal transduction histidine kinase
MNSNGDTSFEQLLRLNRANNLLFFVGGFCHTFNNPLNSIHLASNLLNNYSQDINALFNELSDEPEQVPTGFREAGLTVAGDLLHVIQGVSDSVYRLNRLVSLLSEFISRGATAASHDVDLNRLISLCASLADHQIRGHTSSFTLNLEPDLPILPGNAEQMLQVILNLLMNSLLALNDRFSAVVLSTTCDRAANCVTLSVRDEGTGISPDIFPDIRAPFFSTWQAHGCIGIGLTVADQIIRNHGGKLCIDSEPEKGTTVIVSLPISTITECNHA